MLYLLFLFQKVEAVGRQCLTMVRSAPFFGANCAAEGIFFGYMLSLSKTKYLCIYTCLIL